MRGIRLFAPSVLLGLLLCSLSVIGNSSPGFAAEPHVCIGNSHPASWYNLGGVNQFTFTWARICGTHTSNTEEWKVNVYNFYNQTQPICSAGPAPLPPDTIDAQPAPCTGLPIGTGARIKAVIDYKVPGSTWMAHVDYFRNY